MHNLKSYQQRLLKMRKDLKKQIERMEEGQLNQTSRESVGELSIIDNHPADMGDVTYERGKDIALRDNLHLLLNQVEDALGRIDRGQYGICELCGKRISGARLNAVPYTTVCKECREEYDGADGFHRRPINRLVEEDVLRPPFGRGFNDNRDITGFDAEDSWQKAARYGTSNSPSDVRAATEEDAFVDWDDSIGQVSKEEEIADEDTWDRKG